MSPFCNRNDFKRETSARVARILKNHSPGKKMVFTSPGKKIIYPAPSWKKGILQGKRDACLQFILNEDPSFFSLEFPIEEIDGLETITIRLRKVKKNSFF